MKSFISGSTIDLRPLSLQDVEGDYVGWLNDREVTAFNSHGATVYTKEKAIEYINSVTDNPIFLVLAIVAKDLGKHIGNISLQNIDAHNQSAEFAILIGNKEYWAKGVGFEAASLLIEHGFSKLNLHRIYCGTSEKNIGMQKLAKKLGMTEEGRRKDAMFKNGEFVDVIEYGLVRN